MLDKLQTMNTLYVQLAIIDFYTGHENENLTDVWRIAYFLADLFKIGIHFMQG